MEVQITKCLSIYSKLNLQQLDLSTTGKRLKVVYLWLTLVRYDSKRIRSRRRTAHAQWTLAEHVVGDGGEVLPPSPARRPASRAGSRRRRGRHQLPLALDTHVVHGWGAGAHWMRRPSARSIGMCACAYSLVRGWAFCVHEHMQLDTSPRAPLHASRLPRPPFHRSAVGTGAPHAKGWWEWFGPAARAQKLCGPCPVCVRLGRGRASAHYCPRSGRWWMISPSSPSVGGLTSTAEYSGFGGHGRGCKWSRTLSSSCWRKECLMVKLWLLKKYG